MLEMGSTDIVAGLIAKPERERYSYFLPYRPDSSYSFISQLSLPAITHYEELKQYSIGISRDTQYFERFDQDKNLRKLVTNDVNVATNMLLKERFQVLIVPTTVLPSLKRRFPQFEQQLIVHPYSFKEDRIIYFGLSKKHQLDLPIEQIESIVTKAYEQGLFMQEIDKFISEHIEYY
ncbi:hypothetical protein K0I73_11650 [Shewanella mesophila]|uniref:transporter substrate-binding domain-containing protein n=1 Tax=Shewanella mesophila TaxID=2864208 RepID=UPI001C65C917|nr:transporter substrate-binding domain-containing protein [Shewanella mesophila]QYJ84907.1 hypothetical protein K0I73_11650 [Shewanella mesophila]